MSTLEDSQTYIYPQANRYFVRCVCHFNYRLAENQRSCTPFTQFPNNRNPLFQKQLLNGSQFKGRFSNFPGNESDQSAISAIENIEINLKSSVIKGVILDD